MGRVADVQKKYGKENGNSRVEKVKKAYSKANTVPIKFNDGTTRNVSKSALAEAFKYDAGRGFSELKKGTEALAEQARISKFLKDEKEKEAAKIKYENFDVEAAKGKLNDSEYWLNRINENRTLSPGKINLDDSEIIAERKQLEKDIKEAEAYQSAQKAETAKKEKEESEKQFYLSYDTNAGKERVAKLQNEISDARHIEVQLQHEINTANRSGNKSKVAETREKLNDIRQLISSNEKSISDIAGQIENAEKTKKQKWYEELPNAEDFKEYSEGGFYGNFSPKVSDKARYGRMTDEEVAIYRYLANKDHETGTREAPLYLESLKEVLEQRKGVEWGVKARSIDNPIGRGLAAGGAAAVSGLTNAVEGTATFLTGEAIEPDALDYAAGYIRQDLDGVAGAAFDVTQSISNLAPSVLLGSITGIPAVGTVAFGTSAIGNAYSAAISEGYSEDEARTYAWLTGASEAALQYLLGGISSLGGKATNNILAKVINKIDGAGLKLAVNLGGNMLSEGIEEGLQTYLEAEFRKLIFDEEYNVRDVNEEAIYSAMLGAVTSFLLESPGATTNAYVDNAIEKAEYQEMVDALKIDRNAVGTLDFVQNAEYNYNKQYSKKTSYWKPDLSKRQMNRLMAEIRKDVQIGDNNLTDKANWFVADIEGTPVLAIYSTENTQEPTLLYESKNERAKRETEYLKEMIEVLTDGENSDGESGAFSTVSSGSWMQQSTNLQDSVRGLGGTRSSANASVLQRQSKGKPTRAFINVIENLTTERGRVNNKEEAADVGATSTASSSYSEGVETASPIKPGFTPTEYSKKIGNKTLRALDAIGKKIGVEISIGAPTGDGKGAHNGYYENGRIVIAQDATNPLEVVLCHEVTHHMQRTAPAEYNMFVEFAVNASEKLSGAEKTELIERYRQEYANGSESFSDQESIDEITADYSSRLVNDISLFRELVKSNRNVAQRFLEGVKDFLAKVKSTFSKDKAKADTASMEKYGTTVSELEMILSTWEKMISETEEAVASGNINTADTEADGGTIYSLKMFKDGKRFVEVQTDQHLFDGLTYEEKRRMATQIIKERFSGKVVGRDNRVFVNGRSAAEYGRPRKKLGVAEHDAKMRASTELDNLIDAGTNFRTEPDGKDGHIHPQATDDFKYFDTIFKVGNEYYQGTINILPNAKGDLLIDITQIKNITQDIGSSYGTNPKSTFLRDNSEDINSSDTIISDSSEKSNRQNSLKTEDLLSREYSETEDTSSVSRSSTPSPQGEGSKEAGVDEYFDDIEKRAQVVSDERLRAAESALMDKPGTKKKTVEEKAKESASFLKRKFVNSGDAVRKIAKATKDKHLYGAFNRARSSMNIVSDMLKNKQTNVLGWKVGESLEGIIAPIKEKGDEYFRDFQLYLLHKHNVARMGLKDTKAEARAQAELELFIKENPDVAAMGETELQKRRLWEDDRGLKARKYLDLRENLNQAQNTNNKPIFFDNDNVPLSAQESESAAAELLRKNPGFKEDEAKIRTYLDNLMEYRVDSGLITREEAEYFRKKYPDYVPTYRDTENVQKQLQGKLNIGTAVGRAKGGNEKILPLDVALAEMTKKVVRSGQKNIFANKLYTLYEKNSDAFKKYITDVQEGKRDVDSEIDSFGDAQILDNTVRFHNEGKSVEFTVTPELFEAFDAISNVPKEQPAVARTVRKINDVYKKLITTYDPTFIVRNGIKDLQDALLNSTSTRGLIKNLPRAYKEIATGGEMWELYQAAGGLYSSRFEELHDKGIVAKGGKKNLLSSVVEKTKEAIPFCNMLVEQAPRLAEFMTVYEKGDPNSPDTLSDALLAAAEVTTNFGESGTWGKVLNAYYIPFLNPSIQGTARLARTFTGDKTATQWAKLAAKCAVMGLGAGFLNDLLANVIGDDEEKEEYENLTDRTKDNYYLIPTDDGKFIKLPKGRVAAALGIVTDRLRDAVNGEKIKAGETLGRIGENLLPENPLNNNIFKAWFDADLMNKESKGRTWYGTDIESESLQSLPVGERFDSSTDYVSKYVGKALGVSPKKLNYILEQYTGGVGRMILPAFTPKEQKGDNISEKVGYGLWGIITSNFSVDSKLSNKVSGEFYDAVSDAEQQKNSSKGTLADRVVYKHLNRERNMMSSYNSKIRDAETDKSLTSKERQAAVRVASAERTAYQKTVLENIDDYRESVEKYLGKYPGSDEEKKIEYAYREANRELYGEEYAIRVNGGSDVYKKAEEKVKRGKTTWKKYYNEYFGKTDRRYDAISDRFGISYKAFEKIENAISKNSTKTDEVAAIKKLGYKDGVARRIYSLYYDTK